MDTTVLKFFLFVAISTTLMMVVYVQQEPVKNIFMAKTQNYKTEYVYPQKQEQTNDSKKANFTRIMRSYPDGDIANLSCRTCAYVTGSGHLLNSKKGSEIDNMDCVIRSNDAPTKGFESDVGRRTTIRTVDRRSLAFYTEALRSKSPPFQPGEKDSVIVLGFTLRTHQLRAAMETTLDVFPNLHLFEVVPDALNQSMESVLNLIGKNSMGSNGFYTIYFLHHLCREIHVYGIDDEEFCTRVRDGKIKLKDVRYHYYGNDKRLNCDLIIKQQKDKSRAHRFINEKKIFRRWAAEWGNLHFHAPEWVGRE